MKTFASLIDSCQSALCSNLSIELIILHLLISAYLQIIPPSTFWSYIPNCYLQFIKPCPQPRSIPLSPFRGHNLGFLTVSFFTMTGCRPVVQIPTLRASPTPGQGGPAIHPGTRYPFWSPFTTFMACNETVLFPCHHTGI